MLRARAIFSTSLLRSNGHQKSRSATLRGALTFRIGAASPVNRFQTPGPLDRVLKTLRIEPFAMRSSKRLRYGL
jgi:hypothetical protein